MEEETSRSAEESQKQEQLEEEEEALQLEDQQQQLQLQPAAEQKLVLQFMDSAHNYLSLFHELSSKLRQGWLELASARHSMGASRINSSLLTLNFNSAATSLKITNYDVDSTDTQPHFVLRKWVSSQHESNQHEIMQLQDSDNMKSSAKNLTGPADDDEVQKERSKSLSVFGILISPKLRAAQLSFERALETLVEIANMRSSLQYSFHQLHQNVKDNEE